MAQFVRECRRIFRGVQQVRLQGSREEPNGRRDPTRVAQFFGSLRAVGTLHPRACLPADRAAVVLRALPGLPGLVPSSVGGFRFKDCVGR